MAFTGETITFSELSNGWTSFWSYLPDWMIGMNSSFYTWKNGDIYKHNSNSARNKFYGTAYNSTLTTVFNAEPASMKMFKTLSIDSTHAWDAELSTDLSTGQMDHSYFLEKEGAWLAYIRRVSGSVDNKAISTQGIGSLTSYLPLVLTFSYKIGTGISTGDMVYKVSGSNTLVLLGEVASHTSNDITLVSTAVAPSPGDMIVYVKNSQAESFGARGYYMDCKLTLPLSVTTEAEIFSTSTNIFKSNP